MRKKKEVHLNEEDLKDIIAEHASKFVGFEHVTKDHVKLEYGIRDDEAYLKVCKIENGGK